MALARPLHLTAALAALAAAGSAQIVLEPPVAVPVPEIWATERVGGDLDGDGLGDLVVSCNAFPARLVSLLATPSGELVPGPLDETGPTWHVPRLGFLDGDGRLDLVAAVGGLPGGPQLVTRRGLGDGDFAEPDALPEDDAVNDILLADLDADGMLDVATAGPTLHLLGYEGGVEVYKGDGHGGFTKTWQHDPGDGGFYLDAGDVDDDGLLDVVMGGPTPHVFPADMEQWLYRHVSACTFAPPELLPHKGLQVELVDIDLDGALDLLSLPLDGETVDIQRGLGGGAFAPAVENPLLERSNAVVTGDFDGDGLTDVVAQLQSAELQVLRNVGALELQHGPVLSNADGHAWPTPVDVDGDGLPELVLGLVDDSAEVLLVRNATYGPDEPFEDLGHALAGSQGWPVLVAEGSLLAGRPFAFRLANGEPGATALLVVGVTRVDAPFKGGTLVPLPDLLLGFGPIAADGALSLAGSWPTASPGGLDVWFQAWFQDPGAPQGWAASTAIVGHLPP